MYFIHLLNLLSNGNQNKTNNGRIFYHFVSLSRSCLKFKVTVIANTLNNLTSHRKDKEQISKQIILFILFLLSDKHIEFWTTVEDGNLSQTYLFENTNIKLYFPHRLCERPPSTLFYNKASRSHTQRPERCDAWEIYIYIDTYICIYIKKIVTTKVLISSY